MSHPHDSTTILSKKWYHFLSPRYWALWFALGLLRLCICLPYGALMRLGQGLGLLVMHVLPKRRHITAVNLKLCFPHLSEAERAQMMRESFKSAGMGLMETALAWWASDDYLRKKLVVNGIEHIVAAKQKQQGLMFMTGHFTSIELGIRLLSFCTPIYVMYRPQNSKLFEWILQRARKGYVVGGITRYDARGMLKTLHGDNAICYTPDQDYGRLSSVFAPFFNVPAASVTGTSRFIKRSGAAVVPGFYYRHLATKQYSLNFFPALENFPSEDDVQDATRVNQIIEQAILKAPTQYMWQHRRFKTRPEGVPYPY